MEPKQGQTWGSPNAFGRGASESQAWRNCALGRCLAAAGPSQQKGRFRILRVLLRLKLTGN